MKKLMFILTMVMSFVIASAQNLYVYTNNNKVDTIPVSNINKVEHSKYDLNGNEQKDFVQMIIRTNEDVYHYLISQISRVSFNNNIPFEFSNKSLTNIHDVSVAISGKVSALNTAPSFNQIGI